MIRMPIRNGSILLWPDSSGKPPLELAAQNGHAVTVELLLENLVKPNSQLKDQGV